MTSTWVALMGAQVLVGGNRYPGRYVEAGTGEPLILLHGQGGHIENFSRNIMPYAEHFHVFALDCVWHGYGAQPPFDPELLPTYVDQVLDFLDWKGIDSAHLEGQSMGGWTAMRVAALYPPRVRKLILTTPQGFRLVPQPGEEPARSAPTAESGRRQLTYLQDPSLENIRKRMSGLLANPNRMPDEMIAIRQMIYSNPVTNRSLEQVNRAYMGDPTLPSQRHVLTERELAQIKAPTLVYWGDKNKTPPALGRRLADSIPDARFYCAADAGHWAQFEHADEHNREVLRFLTNDSTLQPVTVESEPVAGRPSL